VEAVAVYTHLLVVDLVEQDIKVLVVVKVVDLILLRQLVQMVAVVEVELQEIL
jgi:hypothetical protein